MGQVVQVNINPTEQIDISNLSAGMYFVLFDDVNGIQKI